MPVKYDDNCSITCTDTDQTQTANILDYRKGNKLVVAIAGNKINMNWNGKVYVGNASHLEFTSSGPKEIVYKETR